MFSHFAIVVAHSLTLVVEVCFSVAVGYGRW